MGSELRIPVGRVHYREGQTLAASDLADEQADRIAWRRRHNVAGHVWGLAQGLALRIDAAGVLILEPGFAIDGYGRELVVADSVVLPPGSLMPVSACSDVDAWLHYRLTEVEGGARVREETWLYLECVAAAAGVAPRRPVAGAAPDGLYPPYLAAPRDLEAEWPVYLGRITPATGEVVTRDVPRVQLVGTEVRAPWGPTWMTAGAAGPSGERFCLAADDAAGQPVPRLVIDAEGQIALHGELRLTQSAATAAGLTLQACEAGSSNPALILGRLGEAPKTAAPWSLYRVPLAGGFPDASQLRIEVLHPGAKGDPSCYELAVGPQTKGVFVSTLSVRADGTLVITGNLEIAGDLIEGPIDIDPGDERFHDLVIANWAKGLTTAGQEVDASYAATLVVELVDQGPYGSNGYRFQVSIFNVSPSWTSSVKIVRAELEIRDAQSLCVYRDAIEPDELLIEPQSYCSGEALSFTYPLKRREIMNVAVVVSYLGAAQSIIQTRTSKLVDFRRDASPSALDVEFDCDDMGSYGSQSPRRYTFQVIVTSHLDDSAYILSVALEIRDDNNGVLIYRSAIEPLGLVIAGNERLVSPSLLFAYFPRSLGKARVRVVVSYVGATPGVLQVVSEKSIDIIPNYS
jgi:hypothetical protein